MSVGGPSSRGAEGRGFEGAARERKTRSNAGTSFIATCLLGSRGQERGSADDEVLVALVFVLEFHFAFVDGELDRGIGRNDIGILRFGLTNLIFHGVGVNGVLVTKDRSGRLFAIVLGATIDGFLRNDSAGSGGILGERKARGKKSGGQEKS